MSSPAHTDIETISPAGGARGSPDPIETEDHQSLPISSAPIPSPDYTPATPHSDEESEPMEAFETRIALPSNSTSPLSPDHPLIQTSPTPTPYQAFYYSSNARMAMHPSSSASPASSSILPLRKRYQGTFKPILDTKTKGNESEAEGTDLKSEESEDEGPDSESKEAVSEDQQQQAVLVKDTAIQPVQQTADETTTHRLPVRTTWEDLVDGTIYTDIEFVMPSIHAPVQTPASPEWSSGSLLVSPTSWIVPSPVSSPVPTTVVGKGVFLEIGAQLELHGSILHDHTERLYAFPPTLLEGMGQDISKLYDRYEDQREIHALRMQHATDQQEMQELIERVATLERRMDHLEE
ncbi:hypothetical protein Tco_0829815 [Tanacetum coccineum]